QELSLLHDAYLLIEGDRIVDFGPMDTCPEDADKLIDATGRMVLPSWCDSHTHLVFAGSRELEFVDRIKGLSYQEIAQKGGGILNSAKRLQNTSAEELLESAYQRLLEIQKQGTGAVEIKSGYGLTVESELKILRVVQKLKTMTKMPIKATFLGAHAVPAIYKENRKAYIDLILNEMLPQIAEEGLADYIDVFCEKVAFSVAETELLMEAGAKYGLKPKIHTNQFNCMGGIQASVAHGAISVDHLEVVNDEEIACLLNSNTIPTLLPSAPFFINDHYPPARKMIDAGLGVALATDYNPGSTPSGRMPLVVSLACIKMRMLPEEAINAATLNGAYAMELQDEVGTITKGKLANLIITKPIPSLAYIPYAFGSDVVDQVMIAGELK
ncbi:MAG: imidazolonepropionase, partial [Aureispira sp.]|nr:imidazolonepropionase [Aureispira sp.]